MDRMVRILKWLLLVFAVMLAAGAVYFTVIFFPKAFPIIDLDIKVNRAEILAKAGKISQDNNWWKGKYRQSAAFDLDAEFRDYVELKAGGVDKFREAVAKDYYQPYQWVVRQFVPEQKYEVLQYFRPDGRFYGFKKLVPEEKLGEKLSSGEAQKIAKEDATKIVNFNFTNYKLVETQSEKKISKRIDHTFVYERQDVKIGSANLRVKLVVSGNDLTEAVYFVKIPELFLREYSHIRSANELIALLSGVLMGILYIFGGCVLGGIYLLRQKLGIFKPAILAGTFIAFLVMLASVNEMPLEWMGYDSALSYNYFLLARAVSFVLNFLLWSVIFSFIVFAAEGLSRKAFGNHTQLWRNWLGQVASSTTLAWQTFLGYTFCIFDLAYVVFFYLLTTKYFAWWTPSGALADPNMLATYWPWFSPIANALQAGFIEECLFRAIPLAGAAILGKKLGRPRLFIFIALILQAFIFSAAHATYASLPSYSRLIELMIPSLIYGVVYLTYGLFPVILAHTLYDAVLMGLPVFVASFSAEWLSKIILISLIMLPIIILLIARFFNKKGQILERENLNSAWKAEKISFRKKFVPNVKANLIMPKILILFLGIIGILALLATVLYLPQKEDAVKLKVSKKEAIVIAKKYLQDRGEQIDYKKWQVLGSVSSVVNESQKFVWQEEKEAYQRLSGSYINPTSWQIRLVKFKGDQKTRAEEYFIGVNGKREVIQFSHKLAEEEKLAGISEEEAKKKAYSILADYYRLTTQNVKEIAVESKNLPNRLDWVITLTDLTVALKKAEARIDLVISGDKITGINRYIWVPEAWSRENRQKEMLNRLIHVVSRFIITFIFILFLGLAFFYKKLAKFANLKIMAGIILTAGIFYYLNQWPRILAGFFTEKPFLNQILINICGQFLLCFFMVFLVLALVLFFKQFWADFKKKDNGIILAGLSLALGFGFVFFQAMAFKLFNLKNPILYDWSYLGDLVGIYSLIINKVILLLILSFFMVNLAYWLMVLENKVKNFKLFLVISFIIFGMISVLLCGIVGFFVLPDWWVLFLVLTTFLAITYWAFARFNNLIYLPLMVLLYLVWSSVQRFF